MENYEIMLILNDVYESDFLEGILLLQKNEKKYKQSDFYKIVKMNLSDLYKYYYTNRKSKESLIEQFNIWFNDLDDKIVSEKLESIFKKLQNSETVKEFFNNFDIAKIMEEFKEVTGDLKEINK